MKPTTFFLILGGVLTLVGIGIYAEVTEKPVYDYERMRPLPALPRRPRRYKRRR